MSGLRFVGSSPTRGTTFCMVYEPDGGVAGPDCESGASNAVRVRFSSCTLKADRCF